MLTLKSLVNSIFYMEKSGKNIYGQQHEAQLSKPTDKKDSKLVKAINKCIMPISTRVIYN